MVEPGCFSTDRKKEKFHLKTATIPDLRYLPTHFPPPIAPCAHNLQRKETTSLSTPSISEKFSSHPFTALAVIPSTILSLKNKKAMMIGNTLMTNVAPIAPQSVIYWPIKFWIPTVNVL